MLRRFLVLAIVCLVAVPALGESKPKRSPAKPVPVAPASATAAPPAAPGAVEVLWGGTWWAAEVLESRAGVTRIHYTGWGPEWDEWVGPERIRSAAPSRPLGSARVGQRVEVEWHGTWWAAEVVAKKRGFYKIHYTGWGPEWDEWVEPPRMRTRAPAPRATPSAFPEVAGSRS
jgi:hypothetical protein